MKLIAILIVAFYICVLLLSLLCFTAISYKLRRMIRKHKMKKNLVAQERLKFAYPPMDLRLKE